MQAYDRQQHIAALIDSQDFCTQQHLLAALQDQGVDMTQTMLSRDLRKICAHKQGGVYKTGPLGYALDAFSKVLSVECIAPNMIIVKTTPGLASSAALLIDESHIEGIAGTIAGDDTIFICIYSNANQSTIIHAISNAFRFRRS